MLNTFFFGYLSLKYKRLSRALSLFFYVLIIINFFNKVSQSFPTYWNAEWYLHALDGYIDVSGDYFVIFFSITFPLLIALISWLVKPFVVKED